MRPNNEIQPLFDKVVTLDRAISTALQKQDVRNLTKSRKEQTTLFEAIARHFMAEYDSFDANESEEAMPREPNMGKLTRNDRVSLDYLIEHIRAMQTGGVATNELVQLSRVLRRHIEAGYRLPAYMAERGIRLRKSPKGWNYIHEDWDF